MLVALSLILLPPLVHESVTIMSKPSLHYLPNNNKILPKPTGIKLHLKRSNPTSMAFGIYTKFHDVQAMEVLSIPPMAVLS